MKLGIRTRFRRARDTLQIALYLYFRKALDQTAAKAFTDQIRNVGPGCLVCHPFYLKNPQYVRIGMGFSAKAGLRIEAWDSYSGQTYAPKIVIGNNVIVNYDVHIGAITTIAIGNNVLIGSHVLITDHSHGRLDADEADLLAVERPLYSKGPVIIEDNVWIGEGACILPGVSVGRNAVIGANSVVNQNIPAGWAVGGVPAKPLFKLTYRLT